MAITRPEYNLSDCYSELLKFELTAHWYHINTTDFAEHKSLDFLKDSVAEIKDKILEVLLGYIPRESRCKISYDLNYQGKGSSIALGKELWKFADHYEKMYAEKGWGDLEQLFQTLKEHASRFNYLISLK